jgi:hypothetical protein
LAEAQKYAAIASAQNSEAAASSSAYLATPEGRYESALKEAGLDPTSYTDLAFGQETCTVLRAGGVHPDGSDATGPGMTPPQYLVVDREVNDPASQSGKASILAVQILCPEQKAVLAEARSGKYPAAKYTAFPDGHYKVGVDIDPGTYRSAADASTGVITDCYWERSAANGNIIDNNFASAATVITVTVRASDAVFTTQGCPLWKKVG